MIIVSILTVAALWLLIYTASQPRDPQQQQDEQRRWPNHWSQL